MLQSNPIDELVQDAWTAPQPRGGVAPLRYDLAVALYLAEQAAHRKADARKPGSWRSVARIIARISQVVGGGSALPAIRPDRWRNRAA